MIKILWIIVTILAAPFVILMLVGLIQDFLKTLLYVKVQISAKHIKWYSKDLEDSKTKELSRKNQKIYKDFLRNNQ